MPNEEELKTQADNAWAELQRYQNEVIAPHSYKEKKGRRMELINPWKTLAERIEAENHVVELFWAYNRLSAQYWKQTGKRLEAISAYRKQETPNGDRFVRKDGDKPSTA